MSATDTTNSVTSSYSDTHSFQVAAGGAALSNGEFDLSQVHILLGPPIATWPQTQTITDAYEDVDNGQLCIYHTGLEAWPTTAFFGDPTVQVQGNQWVFAFIGGQWYGGAADYFRPGQACKGVTADTIGQDAFYLPGLEPLHSWIPQPGDIFALAATTPARAWPNMATLDERTDVKVLIWP